MGGSDQWGNITSGTEFVRKNLNGKAYAITTPLLTKSDGSKFGKSEEGNIWLDPELTSPYQFYQFWLRADDADLPTFFRYFSDKGKDEIEILEQELAEEPRALKKLLAEELTRQVHSKKDLRAVEEVSATLFDKKLTHNQLMKMDSSSFELIRKEIPTFGVPQEILSRGISLDLLLTQPTNILNSKSDVRRAVQNNAISINKIKMNAHDIPISDRHLIHNKFIFVENGKKNKYLIQLADDPT